MLGRKGFKINDAVSYNYILPKVNFVKSIHNSAPKHEIILMNE